MDITTKQRQALRSFLECADWFQNGTFKKSESIIVVYDAIEGESLLSALECLSFTSIHGFLVSLKSQGLMDIIIDNEMLKLNMSVNSWDNLIGLDFIKRNLELIEY